MAAVVQFQQKLAVGVNGWRECRQKLMGERRSWETPFSLVKLPRTHCQPFVLLVSQNQPSSFTLKSKLSHSNFSHLQRASYRCLQSHQPANSAPSVPSVIVLPFSSNLTSWRLLSLAVRG